MRGGRGREGRRGGREEGEGGGGRGEGGEEGGREGEGGEEGRAKPREETPEVIPNQEMNVSALFVEAGARKYEANL